MTESTTEPQTDPNSKSKNHRKITFGRMDAIIFGAIIIAVVVLSTVLYNMIILRRDVANAKVVATEANLALQKRDGEKVWKLGSPEFQKSATPAELTQAFNGGKNLNLEKSTLYQQGAVTTASGRKTYFIFRYDDLKVPVFVRVELHHVSTHWYITGVSRSTDPSGATPASS